MTFLVILRENIDIFCLLNCHYCIVNGDKLGEIQGKFQQLFKQYLILLTINLLNYYLTALGKYLSSTGFERAMVADFLIEPLFNTSKARALPAIRSDEVGATR